MDKNKATAMIKGRSNFHISSVSKEMSQIGKTIINEITDRLQKYRNLAPTMEVLERGIHRNTQRNV